jgi:triosephosphate isomerase
MTALAEAAAAAQGAIEVGAQNMHPEPAGAFTGEVSARMILEGGAAHVLIGHSERRTHFGESGELLGRKVAAGLSAGLGVLYCVGEHLAEREAGRTEAVLRAQIDAGLAGIDERDLARLEVAYEPVWAIGTGRVAEVSQVVEIHRFLRRQLSDRWREGGAVPILYGGSVQPANARDLLAAPGVDGVLVGGASLEAGSFLAIAAAAPESQT